MNHRDPNSLTLSFLGETGESCTIGKLAVREKRSFVCDINAKFLYLVLKQFWKDNSVKFPTIQNRVEHLRKISVTWVRKTGDVFVV